MADRSRKLLCPEIMDEPALPLAATTRALSDLERVNRWLLGMGASRRTLLARLADGPREQSLIDIGSGSGQVPQMLQRAAARRGVCLKAIGVDRKLSHLLYGRRLGRSRFHVVASAESLPFRDGAGHWSFSNLFFHHFTPEANRRILGEMRRIARRGAVVVDLRQAILARMLVRLLLPLLRVGPVASYDGTVSADQAWSLGEIIRLAAELPVTELRRRFPFRFSLVMEPD